MLLAIVSGALGAPLEELGLDIDGDGIVDMDVSELDLDADLMPDLVEVEGYYTADGTWVEPYFRTAPDSSIANNLGSYGLVNS